MSARRRTPKRGLVAVAVAIEVMVSAGTLTMGSSAPPTGTPPGPAGPLERLSVARRWQQANDPKSPPVEPVRSAARMTDEPSRGAAPQIRLPQSGGAEVTLTRERRRVGTSPVVVAAGSPAAEGRRLRVDVLDRVAAQRAGAAGFVFTVSTTGVSAPSDGPLPVDLAIDYSGFADLFGAGFGDRLRVVALPACALSETPTPNCPSGGVTVPGRNDTAADRLTVSVPDLGALAPDGAEAAATQAAATQGAATQGAATEGAATRVTLAVTAGPGGDLEGSGDFKATPLELSSDWQVSIGSGEFKWTYKVPVPAAPAGTAPSLSVDYSSGSVDGLTSTRNTQASQSGVGWSEFANSFVERRYTPCIEEVDQYPAIGDLCWKSDNATLSLNGRSSQLVRVPNTNPKQWRLKRDPRWKVEQLTGTLANGDNNREYWKVTTPDGVQYFFGLGVKPESNNAPTSSVYGVPVMANHDGEPCRGSVAGNIGDSLCRQGWRWNLDRVVDPNGNVTTYQYSPTTNYYLAIMGLAGWQPYTRSGRLRLIEYGGNTGAFNGGTPVPPQARIDVGGAHRCETLDPDGACRPPTSPTPGTTPETRYPDVPIDQICTSPSGTGCNTMTSPTFFTSVRYTKLTMQVLVAGAWTSVDGVSLTHRFEAENADGTGQKKLYLTGLQRTGRSGATPIVLPGVAFGLTRLNNRVVNTGSTLSKMPHLRVSTVVDEFGRKLTIGYGQPHPCATTDPPPGGWDNNQRNCFRQQYLPEGATDPNWGVFNKWLVTNVTVEDTTGGSPAMVTSYAYGAPTGDTTGDPYPAWHYDADAFFKDGDLQWTDWRGYGTVTMTQGSAKTRYRVYRGMHRDRTGTGGERTVDIKSLDGTTTVRDFDWLSGRTLDEAKLATDGSVLQGALHEYIHVATVDDDTNGTNEPHPFKAAVWSDEKTATMRTKKDGGGFVQTRSTTTYNGFLLFPETRYEEGRLDVTGDERCTRTGHVFDANKWMLDFPSSSTLMQGTCSSTTVLTESLTAYDGLAVGAAPTRGNVSNSRTHIVSNTWAETRTTYDALGRPRVVTDPNGHNTTTTYAPATGYPTKTDVTNHLGHRKTTNWLVGRQVPASEVDPRGKVTTYQYDALGRCVRAWRPTEPTTGPASWEFSYVLSTTKSAPPHVRTRQLQSITPSLVYIDSWVVYDSLLRERQDQRLSPTTGKVIVTNSRYNDRGLVESKSLPQALTGTPGTLFAPANGAAWDNENLTAYDELGRPIWEIFFTAGGYRWSTTKAYGHDTTTALPHPSGGETVTTVDAYGKVVKVAEWAARGDPASAATTGYARDLAGRLKKVTDPRGNTIDYGYDLAGRRTSVIDRDAGSWVYGYDLAGNQTSVRDARNVTTFTTYDAINRPTARHSGDPTKPLATFAYDNTGETGLLNNAVRWVRVPGEPVRAYVTDVLGYDDRGRPNGRSWIFFDVDLPGVVPPSPDGSPFPVTYEYDRADHVTKTTYPQVGDPGSGGLPVESVTVAYNSVGLPVGMDGAALPSDQDYLYSAGYDDRARPLLFGYGKEGSGVGKLWLYNADQRLARQAASASGVVLQDREFSYEETPAGKVTSRKNTINARTWMDCYRYDTRNRLTRAYSTSHADDCALAAAGGGDGPYDVTYTYSDDGNITQRVESGDLVTYTYPAGGGTSVRPHAATRLDFPGGGDDLDYTWDVNGHMLTRTKGGTTETFTWNAERRLDAIETRNATGSSTSSFLYDVEGNRLLRRDVDRTTAYFEGHEVSVSKSTSGNHITSVRTYSLEGVPIATRSASGGEDPTKDKVEYLITDNQGSVELSARNSESTPVVDRTYDPYGGKRTGNDALTDRGFIGEIEDHRSGLSYLNARYYDPNLHRFVSPDPLFDEANPQTINPYAYGLNNPVAFSDPSGLIPLECATGELACHHTDNGWQFRSRPESGRTGGGGHSNPARDKDMNGESSSALLDLIIQAGLIPRTWRSMVAGPDDENWSRYCVRRIHDPSCTLSGDFLPQVLATFRGEGRYTSAHFAGAWAVPQAGQGAIVLQREYRYQVEELRFLGTRVTDDGRILLTYDSITREYRQEEYAQVGSIGPQETGISGIDVDDDGDLGLQWSGRTAPTVVPNSPTTNWTKVVELHPDGTMEEW